MNFEEAKTLAEEAKSKWSKATTKEEAADLLLSYGVAIGYKPFIKYVVQGKDAETALKVYLQ